ncbi:DUF5801 repeats-in-toxin domain-containing protein, partial [Oceanimonas smirnovii]|uniref:DUF5801 repeats-in-toxin domain-containing protein n=1 Tax=Oceanimonas smirnovii TaxID=264574 RepID=UPI0037705C11
NDSFTIAATDRDGDTNSDSLTIKIVDDAPEAIADSGSVTEGDTLNVDVAGGVLSNDKSGADGWKIPGTVVGVSQGDTGADVTGQIGVEIAGNYGVLTLYADGSYSYKTNPNIIDTDVQDVFTYTVKDADGDTSTTTLTIDVNDVTGTPETTVGTVDEAGLPAGTNASADVEKVIDGALELQDGWSVISTQSGNASFGSWKVNTDGTFNYTLTSNTEDKAGDETDSFTYTAVDQFGNTVTNTVTITIADDKPVAMADTGNVTEGGTLTVAAADGVLSNDKPGADGWANSGSAVVGVVAGNSDVAAEDLTSVGQQISGQYGTLTLNSDGSYTYVSTANSITGNEQDVFTYTVKDSDGDLVETTLTINVADVTATPTDTTGQVDESGLANGTDSSSTSEQITGGSLNLQPGWSVDSVQTGSTTLGDWTVNEDGTFNYTLISNTEDKAGNETDSFTYTAVDQFGNTVTNTVTITIVDDTPQVSASGVAPGSLTVDETNFAAGTVTATNPNFVKGVFTIDYGADGAATTDGTVYSLNVTAGTASGVTDIATGTVVSLSMNGTDVVGKNTNGDIAFRIEINAETGAVTLTQYRPLKHPDGDNPDDVLSLTDGAIKLEATVKDGDGDTAKASVNVGGKFNFKDDGPSVDGQPATSTVDEKYLSTGSEAGKGSTTVTATLPVDAGEDGIGSLVFSADQSELRTILNLTGNGDVMFAVSGNVLTATRGAEEIFTVTLDKDTGEYTFELKGALTHPSTVSGNFDLSFNYEIKDADGDSAPGKFEVNVVDDAPKSDISITTPEDTPFGPFTTSADSTKDNVSIQNADGNDAITTNTLPDGVTAIPDGTAGYNVGHGVVVVDANGQVTYHPNTDYSNNGSEDNFKVTVSNDDGSSTVTNVTVNVTPVSDAPDIPHANNSDSDVDAVMVTTQEDTSVSLGLKTPVITDNTDQSTGAGDDPERLGEITLSLDANAPAGTVLTKGNGSALISSDGVYKFVITDVVDLHLNGLTTANDGSVNYVTQAEYQAIKAQLAEDRHENFDVVVSVDSFEVDGSGNKLPDSQVSGTNGSNSQQTITVSVEAVTDDAELVFDSSKTDPASITNVDAISYGGTNGNTAATVTIKEDTSFKLNDILNAQFKDLDGSEVRSITIENTTGQPIVVNGQQVAAASSIEIDAKAGASGQTGSITSFPDISIGAVGDFSGELNGIKVTINAQDKDADGFGAPVSSVGSDGTEESDKTNNSVELNLNVTPVAGDVVAGDVTTTEDTAVNFLKNVEVTDKGTGNEVIDKVVFELPTDWVVANSTVSNGASWTVDLTGSTYTIEFTGGTEADREAVLDGFTITPPAHSSADATIELTVTTTDTNGTVTDTKTVTSADEPSLAVKVEVTPVAEVTTPNDGGGLKPDSDGDFNPDLIITAGHDYTTAGEEDAWFTLGTEAGFDLKDDWNNQDADEQTFALLTPELIAGDGSQLDANGSMFRYSPDGGNTWVTQTFGGDAIEVPVEYLDTLQFMGPFNFAGRFEITVQALTRDTDPDDGTINEQISGEATLTNILIKPKADTPTATVTARVKGNEEESIPLSIKPSSSDPSETFNVTINAIPDGTEIVYDGKTLTKSTTGLDGVTVTDNGDGTWQVKINDFKPALGTNMSATPPLHSNDPFDLQVSVETVDTLEIMGDLNSPYISVSDSFDLTINVTPKGVADSADIELVADPTFEEADIDTDGGVMLSALLSKATLTDNDGSEVLTFKIGGLPEGFGLEGATFLGNGQWSFSQSDLASVKITTPANFNGTASFTLYSVTTENDGDSLTEQTQVSFTVTPSPEAGMNTSSQVNEDASALLDFGIQHNNGDTDETISSVWINAADVDGKSDFTLTYGQNGSVLAGGEAGVVLEDGYYKLTGVAINNIYVQGASNWHGEVNFGVRYAVTDPGLGGNTDVTEDASTKIDETYTVTVNPVTDQPTLTVSSNSSISLGAPGAANIDLAIGNTGGDYDGSEQLIRIVLDNVPQGVVVNGADYIGNNQWLLVTTDTFNGELSKTLSLTFTDNAGGLTGHDIGITVTTEDAGNGQQLIASTSVSVTTTFEQGTGPDEPAEILEWTDNNFEPTEDTPFTLDQAVTGQIQDGVTGNGITITLKGLPAGASVSGPGVTSTVIDGQVVWTISGQGGNTELQTLLGNISVTPPANWNITEGNFDFSATLTTYVPSGVRNDAELNLSQQVIPVSDKPSVAITAADVAEGSDLTFTVNVTNPADAPDWTLVDGNLYLQVNDGGVTSGGKVFDANGNELILTPVSGVNGLDDGNYYVLTGVNQATDVNITYRPNSPVASGSVTVDAWIQGQENGAANSIFGQSNQTASITPVNSGYNFTVDNATGMENLEQAVTAARDNLIRVNITDNGLVDDDGSESVGTILLSNVPDGFLVYVGDNAETATAANLSNNAGGDGTTNTWLLGNGAIPPYVAIMPPQHWSGSVTDFKLQVISGESGQVNTVTEQTFDITVEAVADGLASFSPTPSFGNEGDIIRLNLNHDLKDPVNAGSGDASAETMTLQVKGMGEHAAFYLGEQLLNDPAQVLYDDITGIYTISGLTSAEAETLGFVQAADSITALEVQAQTVESANGNTSEWTGWKPITTTITKQFATTGNDNLLWTGEAINGRGGEDTIQLRFGEELTGSELASKLDNIEVIDMTSNGASKVDTLSASDVLNMTDGDNILRIDGDAEDSLTLDMVTDGGWTKGTNDGTHTSYTATVGSDTITLEVSNNLVID